MRQRTGDLRRQSSSPDKETLKVILFLIFVEIQLFHQIFPGGSDGKETQETWVQSLGQADPLEEEMAIHSSTLAWEIPWTEEPGRLQSMGSQRVSHD